MGAGLSYRGLVYYYHSEKHDSMQVDMVLENEVRVLHLDPQAAGRDCATLARLELLRPQNLTP